MLKDRLNRFRVQTCIGNNANYRIDFKGIIIHAFILEINGLDIYKSIIPC